MDTADLLLGGLQAAKEPGSKLGRFFGPTLQGLVVKVVGNLLTLLASLVRGSRLGGVSTCSKYPRKGGGTVREQFQNIVREQFENSSRVGHGEEGEGNQFEFTFAGSFFFKGAGGSSSVRIRVRIAKKRHSSRADEEGLDGEIRKKGCKRGGEFEFQFSSSSS